MAELFDAAWFLGLANDACFLALFVAVFMGAKFAQDALTSFDRREELLGKDNAAVALATAGYYLGVVIVFAGAYLGPTHGLLHDLLAVAGYSALGVVLLHAARWINDFFILTGFSATEEIVRDRNLGAGAVLAANYIAAGLVVAGSVYGQGGGVLTALAFFALGQVAMVVFSYIYDWTAPYKLADEIKADNHAAGIGFAGTLIAIGLIVMDAVGIDFVGWGYNLAVLAFGVVVMFVYLVLVRLFFDRVVLAGAELNREIAQDRNVGAGVLEFAVSVGFAAILMLVL